MVDQPLNQESETSVAPHSARFDHGLFVATILIALVAGFFGGIVAVGIFRRDDGGADRSRELLVQESSAIIDVVNKLSPSVVSVSTETQTEDFFGSGIEFGSGTGIIISEDGLILTNKHVIGPAPGKITVTLSDGRSFEARVIGSERFNDLSYLKIDAEGLTPAELGDSDQVVVGQRVVVIGNALGEFENTVTSGIISGLKRPLLSGSGPSDIEHLSDLFQTDAAINPGNSGGPIVGIDGRVIGITTAIADAENIGFAIPINQAKGGIASIHDHGRLVKPYLGVRYVELTPEIAADQLLPTELGALLIADSSGAAVLAGSPAAEAGLREHDIIIKINDFAVGKDGSLVTLVNRFGVGDRVTLTIIRDAKQQTVEVTLKELPDRL